MGFQVALVVKNSPTSAGYIRDDISAQLDSAVSLILQGGGDEGVPTW